MIGNACLARSGGRYYCVGDDQQCVPVLDDVLFKAAGLDEGDDRYEAFVSLQKQIASNLTVFSNVYYIKFLFLVSPSSWELWCSIDVAIFNFYFRKQFLFMVRNEVP